MTNWKKRWENELDEMVPSLSETVQNAPILVSEYVEERKETFKDWFAMHKKRFFATLATCAAVIVTCVALLPKLFATPTPDNGNSALPVPVKTTAAVMVEINPKAVFSVNTDGKIDAVVAGNSDADVILSDLERRTEILEKSVEEGVQVFVDYAARLGYLDLSAQTAVKISSCENEEILGKVETQMQSYFRGKGAYVMVAKESLVKEKFCERVGVQDCDSVDALTGLLKNMSPAYSERVAEEKGESALGDLYGETVKLAEIERLIEFMEFLGLDTTALKALLELPQTLAEYSQKLQGYFDSLSKENEKKYNEKREEIKEEDYVTRMRELIAEYGSIEAYWETLTK